MQQPDATSGDEMATLAGDGSSAPARDDVEDRRRGDVIGRYVVLERLGRGGMGVVYAAYDPQLDRKIAIKLLRRGAGDGAERLGEAQALARLRHPNVVAIHDVGTVAEHVFLAMEFVEGETLRAWMRERTRSRDDVRRVLRGAAQGLAAVHAAGLVHGDFKPENVVVRPDGTAVVLDFGLARPRGLGPTPSESASAFVLAGTPGYMAPEQLAGAEADARSDQFAFCVTLYEALTGERPFRGDTAAAIGAAVLQGELASAPLRSVPSHLRRVVVRGLEQDSARRFPGMDDVVAALERRRGRLGAYVATVVVAGAVAFAVVDDRAPCADAGLRTRPAWNPERRDGLASALASTDEPYAADVSQRVVTAIDTYVASWEAAYTEACEATHEHGTQPPDVLELRSECLDDRLVALGALVDVLGRGSKESLDHAIDAANTLPELSVCGDVEGLRAGVRPPEDANTARRVKELRAKKAEAEQLESVSAREALALAHELVAEADEVGYEPLRAEARFVLGDLLDEVGEYEQAERVLVEAFLSARSARHGTTAIRTATKLATVVGDSRSRPDDGDLWGRIALAELGARGVGTSLHASVIWAQATLLLRQGRFEEAVPLAQQSLDIFVQTGAPGYTLANAENGLATALYYHGRLDEASAHFARSLDLHVEIYGADHPELAPIHSNMSALLHAEGRHEEALTQLARATEILRKNGLDDANNMAGVLGNEGIMLSALGRHAEALARHRESLAAFEQTVGLEHADTGFARTHFANELIELGRADEALPHVDRALAAFERVLPPGHHLFIHALSRRGRALLALGRAGEARAALERALAIPPDTATEAIWLAQAHFDLAQALWSEAGERPRALAEAGRARATALGARPPLPEVVEQVDRWLASR